MKCFCLNHKIIMSDGNFMSCNKCGVNHCKTMNTKINGLKNWSTNLSQNMNFLINKYTKREEKLKRILNEKSIL